MLSKPDDWLWDSWYVVKDDLIHAFTLSAPKALVDPELRHFSARVGHSVSSDGKTWNHLKDIITPSIGNGFDSQAIWTGSVVHDGKFWHLYFTGIGKSHREKRQAIGHAKSLDLESWESRSVEPVVSATPDYALLGNKQDGSEHFRDPWVFQHDGQWHMLVTASDATGEGTIGHAVSSDLNSWEVLPPLVSKSGFRQLEVVQTVQIYGQWFLIFCAAEADVTRRDIIAGWGTYCAPADGPLGPFHLEQSLLFAPNLYAGRAVLFKDEWLFFGFISDGTESGFTGTISDAKKISLNSNGTLELDDM